MEQEYVDKEVRLDQEAAAALEKRRGNEVWGDNARLVRVGAKRVCAVIAGVEFAAAYHLATTGESFGATALGALGAVTTAIGLVL